MRRCFAGCNRWAAVTRSSGAPQIPPIRPSPSLQTKKYLKNCRLTGVHRRPCLGATARCRSPLVESSLSPAEKTYHFSLTSTLQRYHRGSSPESWLQDEKVFYTRCGYREKTPTTDVYSDYHKGKKPPPTATPKIETLIARYKPTIVIVQLGTNWMDQTLSDDYIRHVLARFVSAVHSNGPRRMIWIGPPDSSRFSKVQSRIYRLIQQSVPRGDPVIDSRRFTRYVMGKTGGDGIHYNSESGAAWAKPVNATLDQILAPDIAVRRKLVSNR